jgi:hypothetical protein
LRLRDRDARIAGIPRVRRRTTGCVRIEVRERKRAAGVAVHVAAVPAALEQETGAKRVLAGGDVEVVGKIRRRFLLGTVDLGAAGVESIRDEDGRIL